MGKLFLIPFGLTYTLDFRALQVGMKILKNDIHLVFLAYLRKVLSVSLIKVWFRSIDLKLKAPQKVLMMPKSIFMRELQKNQKQISWIFVLVIGPQRCSHSKVISICHPKMKASSRTPLWILIPCWNLGVFLSWVLNMHWPQCNHFIQWKQQISKLRSLSKIAESLENPEVRLSSKLAFVCDYGI